MYDRTPTLAIAGYANACVSSIASDMKLLLSQQTVTVVAITPCLVPSVTATCNNKLRYSLIPIWTRSSRNHLLAVSTISLFCESVCVCAPRTFLTQYLEFWTNTNFHQTFSIGAFLDRINTSDFVVKGQSSRSRWVQHAGKCTFWPLMRCLENLLAEFHQTFKCWCILGQDECLNVWGQKAKGQGQSMMQSLIPWVLISSLFYIVFFWFLFNICVFPELIQFRQNMWRLLLQQTT